MKIDLEAPTGYRRRYQRFLEKQAFEPTLTWGFRMALAATLPMIWGIYTGRMEEAIWISLTAESISWVELKGSFAQGVRVLLGGILLTVGFTALGILAAPWLWSSVLAMLFVGFICGLFRNLGERGGGLAICIFCMFILSNAFPVELGPDFWDRILLVGSAGIWNALVGIVFMLGMPAHEPYRRSIALVWKQLSQQVREMTQGWDGQSPKAAIRDLYLREKAVRAALDESFHFYESMADQPEDRSPEEQSLAQFRKATALVAAMVNRLAADLDPITIRSLDPPLRVKIYAILRALELALSRLGMHTLVLKREESILVTSRLARLEKMNLLLRASLEEINTPFREQIEAFSYSTERLIKLIEAARVRLDEPGNDLPVFRSYSLVKTLFILHPRFILQNLRLLLNMDSFLFRYALRMGITAAIGMGIYRYMDLERGYWIPLTSLIVFQPYFSALIKKSLDRILGTLLGGVAGGILLAMTVGLGWKLLVFFVSFILMVHFIHRRYAMAAFFITLNLVLLFNLNETMSHTVILYRAGATIGGALLAVLAGFAFLPDWDKDWLPRHLKRAIWANALFFESSFQPSKMNLWTRYKRVAETENSNTFDSFNRYMQEPRLGRRPYALYFHLITHNLRVTRDLNFINLDHDSGADYVDKEHSLPRIKEAAALFNELIDLTAHLYPHREEEVPVKIQLQEDIPALRSSQLVNLEKLLDELRAMKMEMQRFMAYRPPEGLSRFLRR